MGKIPNKAIYDVGIINLKKNANKLINNNTPMYWPNTTEVLLKSLDPKNIVKTNKSSRLVATNALTATNTVKRISIM